MSSVFQRDTSSSPEEPVQKREGAEAPPEVTAADCRHGASGDKDAVEIINISVERTAAVNKIFPPRSEVQTTF